ncbi:mechanosensitive ion channel family protein [Halanaerobiaceae bacterium Z-7014]|uniref:Mechanosensitive ion channel family protein n=1 Tax=Halonatronomonas betaini TaxID=2778430 RepID=A0A931ASL5_9FIRM|nr:mechanosensitive ion channel family protein [Halonatronomonas betaini]MBF8437687.1 mechanosensitive ion channel family protein [Halonatronomonas betaini]
MTTINEIIAFALSDRTELLRRFILTLLFIAFIYYLRQYISKKIDNRIKDISKKFRYNKVLNYISYGLGFILIFPLWFRGLQGFMTFFGLFSAGLAIALRDMVANIVGRLYLIIRRPYNIGDRIEIGGVKGDVIDIRLFETSLMEIGNWVDSDQSTGRIVFVPNGHALNRNISNYTQGFEFIWNEIKILLTFESDWRKAKKAFQEIADIKARKINREAREKIINSAKKEYKKLTPIVYMNVKESGVELTIRYLCEPRKRRSTNENFWEEIMDFIENNHDVDLAYPTYRIYSQGNDVADSNREENSGNMKG